MSATCSGLRRLPLPGSFQMFQNAMRLSVRYFVITSSHIAKNFSRSSGSSTHV